jgi:phage terminase small subunit
METLTAQERKFVQEYINIRNETTSAIKAGINKKLASRVGKAWLKRPDIIEAINKEIDKSADTAKITRDWCLKQAKKLYDSCERVENFRECRENIKLISDLLTKIDESGGTDKTLAQVNIILNKEDDFRIL